MQINRSRGDTRPVEIVISDGLTPVNLTGAVTVLTLNTLFNPPDNTTQVYQLTGVVDSPATGTVKFTPTVSQANLVGLFYYDIQLTDSNGVVSTLVKDAFNYTQDITK